MFCPECRAEYRTGFTECAGCGVPLVWELPPLLEEPKLELVTVFEARDPGLLAVVKSLLDGAGIPFLVKGERLQHLFTPALTGGIIGPAEVQVARLAEAAARELLENHHEEADGPGD